MREEDELEEFSDEEETGQEDDIYNEDALDEETENDEIDALEEGFMKGYDKESMLRCDQCGQELAENFRRVEIDGNLYRFCSKKCLEEFEESLI
jgi:hypothetical protein